MQFSVYFHSSSAFTAALPGERTTRRPAAGQAQGDSDEMKKFIDSNDISGAVTVVGRKDGIVEFDATGKRDVENNAAMAKKTRPFRIASMTKPITAIGIMILVDEGKLNPDDDVSKYLPEFANQKLLVIGADKTRNAGEAEAPRRSFATC